MLNVFFWVSFVLIVFVVKKLFELYHLRQYSLANECQNPPRNRPQDVLGIFTPITIVRRFQSGNVLAFTKSLFDKYNGTFSSRIVGQDYIFTADPRNVKAILSSQFSSFSVTEERTHLFQHFSSRGVLTLDGSEWSMAREQLRRQFGRYRSMVDLQMLEKHMQIFVSRVPSNGKTMDFQIWSSRLALDALTEFALGESTESLSGAQNRDKREFEAALRCTKDSIARKGFAGPFHFLVGRETFRKACNTVRCYITKFALRTLRDKKIMQSDAETSYCFLTNLAAEEKDVEVLRDQISNILIAGVDAMTSLLSATFFLLARDERVLALLQARIAEVCGSEPPTYDQLKSMTYLRHVINEALRIFPPVPFDMRTAAQDTTLPSGGGLSGTSKIAILKGQNVVFSSYSTHRWVGTYGQDSAEFRPERWEGLKANENGYLPFHIGPRSCPGQQYALMACSYMVVRIVQSFSKIQPRDKRPWMEDISMTLGNANGVHLALSSR